MLFLGTDEELRLREVSGLLALIWSLISLIRWLESTYKWTSELIPKTAVRSSGPRLASGQFSSQSSQAVSRSYWLSMGLHFLEHSA